MGGAIRRFVPAPSGERRYVATINRCADCDGAIFHPIVGWGVEEGGTVVPMVYNQDPEREPSETLLDPYDFDDDFLGVAEEGQQRVFDDVARERLKGERDEEERRDRAALARRMLRGNLVQPSAQSFLLATVQPGARVLEDIPYPEMMQLLEMDLLHLHFNSDEDRVKSEPTRHLSQLGDTVARLLQRVARGEPFEDVIADPPPPRDSEPVGVEEESDD